MLSSLHQARRMRLWRKWVVSTGRSARGTQWSSASLWYSVISCVLKYFHFILPNLHPTKRKKKSITCRLFEIKSAVWSLLVLSLFLICLIFCGVTSQSMHMFLYNLYLYYWSISCLCSLFGQIRKHHCITWLLTASSSELCELYFYWEVWRLVFALFCGIIR